ncbi:MAG: histidinol-phosphatase [Kiritimatiellae bacterium]|nr:histidinol-phosphatase [Kiritimatiellia bacterium]
MKTNYHMHTVWCDGKDAPETMVGAALEKGFSAIGFSSHALLPASDPWTLRPDNVDAYVADIRALAWKYRDRIEILCGIEADFIAGKARPDRSVYARQGLDYLIGSVHEVVAPGGARVPVDHKPELLADGIARQFGGDAQAFVRSYFAAQREMAATCDFDIIGHPDLVRKFNGSLRYFDEMADWYREELRLTADAFAASGKIVEVNTGGISRGWLDDAYPSPHFRQLLRERGVRFILSSDAHSASAIDCAFDRFAAAEDYVSTPSLRRRGTLARGPGA